MPRAIDSVTRPLVAADPQKHRPIPRPPAAQSVFAVAVIIVIRLINKPTNGTHDTPYLRAPLVIGLGRYEHLRRQRCTSIVVVTTNTLNLWFRVGMRWDRFNRSQRFVPIANTDSIFSSSVQTVFGTGDVTPYRAFYDVSGAALVIASLMGWIYSPLRHLERDIPDFTTP